MERTSPLDGMTRSAYDAYQKELVRLLDSGRKTRSDKGVKRVLRRTRRKTNQPA